MAKYIDNTNLGYLISKIKAAFWPKTDVVELDAIDIDLADVAMTGDYEDLSNRPTCPVFDSLPASGGLLPNSIYDVGTLGGTVVITLETSAELSGQLNIYTLCFTADTPAPDVQFPASVTKWAGNCIDENTGLPVLSDGKDYEISIRGNKAIITEFV